MDVEPPSQIQVGILQLGNAFLLRAIQALEPQSTETHHEIGYRSSTIVCRRWWTVCGLGVLKSII